jgi:hypothetical protein
MPHQSADGEPAAQIPLRARKRETSDAVVPAGCWDPLARTVRSVRKRSGRGGTPRPARQRKPSDAVFPAGCRDPVPRTVRSVGKHSGRGGEPRPELPPRRSGVLAATGRLPAAPREDAASRRDRQSCRPRPASGDGLSTLPRPGMLSHIVLENAIHARLPAFTS